MSMFNDIDLEKKNNEDSCALTPRKIKEYASNFNDGHCAFLGPGISPRLMNYAMIPYKWKRFLHHVGRARDQYSIAEIGFMARGK